MPARVAISQGTATAETLGKAYETLGKAYRHGTSLNIAPSASRSTIEAINDTRRLINGLILAGFHTEVLEAQSVHFRQKYGAYGSVLAAFTTSPKTFNNPKGFEQGLWQRQSEQGA
jgi:hypothetical protein